MSGILKEESRIPHIDILENHEEPVLLFILFLINYSMNFIQVVQPSSLRHLCKHLSLSLYIYFSMAFLAHVIGQHCSESFEIKYRDTSQIHKKKKKTIEKKINTKIKKSSKPRALSHHHN